MQPQSPCSARHGTDTQPRNSGSSRVNLIYQEKEVKCSLILSVKLRALTSGFKRRSKQAKKGNLAPKHRDSTGPQNKDDHDHVKKYMNAGSVRILFINVTNQNAIQYPLLPLCNLLLKHIISRPHVTERQSCEKTSPVTNVSMETSLWIQLWTKFTRIDAASILQRSFYTFMQNCLAYCLVYVQFFEVKSTACCQFKRQKKKVSMQSQSNLT